MNNLIAFSSNPLNFTKALSVSYSKNEKTSSGSGWWITLNNADFNASRCSNLYTSTNEVRPLTLRTNVIIKY